MKSYRLLAVFLSIVLALTGCATVGSAGHAQYSLKDLRAAQKWNLQGKVGIQSSKVNGSAQMVWHQENSAYQIRLFGPLGLGAVALNSNPNSQVEFINQNGQTLRANTPEILLKQNLGWDMPVSDLIYWVRAAPAPKVSSVKDLGQDGQLKSLKQQGWLIQYLKYSENNLPQLIQLSRLNRQDIQIKIWINQWNVD